MYFPRVTGTGLHHVLVLDSDPIQVFYPADATPPVGGCSFSAIAAGMLDASALQDTDTVLIRDACRVGREYVRKRARWNRALYGVRKWYSTSRRNVCGGAGMSGDRMLPRPVDDSPICGIPAFGSGKFAYVSMLKTFSAAS